MKRLKINMSNIYLSPYKIFISFNTTKVVIRIKYISKSLLDLLLKLFSSTFVDHSLIST